MVDEGTIILGNSGEVSSKLELYILLVAFATRTLHCSSLRAENLEITGLAPSLFVNMHYGAQARSYRVVLASTVSMLA